MKYPIAPEAFFAEAQFDEPEEWRELFQDALIPGLNRAYEAGMNDGPGYPKNPAERIAACEAAGGPLDNTEKRFIAALIAAANAAYVQGREETRRLLEAEQAACFFEPTCRKEACP